MKSYKNDWFVRELVNASGKKTLGEAAPEWEFSHFGYLGKGGNCQICHTHIVKFVAIKNRRNGILLLVGEDCYDKLIHYLATKKLESVSLQSRKEYVGQIKKYCKKEINAAFLEWFKGREELPETIQSTLRVIQQLGYAPSLAAAEEIVEYYKNQRLFLVSHLLDQGFRKKCMIMDIPWSWLDRETTLAQFPAVQKSLESWLKKWKNPEALMRDGTLLRVDGLSMCDHDSWKNFVQLELSYRKRKFGITIPISDLEKRLGLGMSWTEYYLGAFQKTMPSRVRIRLLGIMRQGKLDGDGLQEWVREARKVIQLEERKKNAIGLAFKKGWNRKHNTEQWEARLSGVLYVLRKEDRYDPSEAEIKVMKVFDLVPERVVLVERF